MIYESKLIDKEWHLVCIKFDKEAFGQSFKDWEGTYNYTLRFYEWFRIDTYTYTRVFLNLVNVPCIYFYWKLEICYVKVEEEIRFRKYLLVKFGHLLY